MAERRGHVQEPGALPFALVGAALLGLGLMLSAFEIPFRASRLVLTVILVLGGACLAVFLMSEEYERR